MRKFGPALCACAVALASSLASAQPRMADEAGGEPLPDSEASAWLRRLVGQYKIDGAVNAEMCVGAAGPPNCSGVKGKVDCTAIGTGPGVQCILNALWPDIYDARTGRPVMVSYLDPSMMLIGLDPTRFGLNMLLVNNKGLPEGGLGWINGNTAIFHSLCVNTPVFEGGGPGAFMADPGASGEDTAADASPGASNSFGNGGFSGDEVGSGSGCRRTVRIEAKADAKIVYMWTQPYNVLLQLRRLAPDEVKATPAKSNSGSAAGGN